jgi:AcrR family transcriptional regulator
MAAKTTARPTARQRLLAAADELFYEEGVHSVGIDRVIERAGVAKASLYNTFGSKDDLVVSYLQSRQQSREDRFTRHIEKWDTPRDRVLSIYDALAEAVVGPRFRGCAFLNATAENNGPAIREVCESSRSYLGRLFRDLVAATNAANPEELAGQLALLYDGATVSAHMDRNMDAPATARKAAEVLLDMSGA